MPALPVVQIKAKKSFNIGKISIFIENPASSVHSLDNLFEHPLKKKVDEIEYINVAMATGFHRPPEGCHPGGIPNRNEA
jgi:hypothetical protein